MKTRITLTKVFIYIVSFAWLCLGGFANAEEQPANQTAPQEASPAPAQENKAEPEKEKVEISPEVIEKTMPSYKLNLKQLIEEAERNIKKVDDELKKQEIFKRNQEKEAKCRGLFEKANALYAQGKLKEAKEEWIKALALTKDPEIQGYIREAEKRACQDELAKKKEDDLQRQESQEKERLEKERELQEELNRKEQERKLKADQSKLERQKKEEELNRKKAEEENHKKLKLEMRQLERQRQEEMKKQMQELERNTGEE